MQIRYHRADYPYRTPFRIAYRTLTHAQTVIVELDDGVHVGRGEAAGISYHGENAANIARELEAYGGTLDVDMTRQRLASELPAGGLRNALDCALWDLEAKRAGARAFALAGLPSVKPLTTAYTLGLDTIDAMVDAARAAKRYPLLKIKLGGKDDIERITAIRAVRPDARIIVDANQAWTFDQLKAFAPELARLGVTLIEQPLAAGLDEPLVDFESPVPLCADESCQTEASLGALAGKYQYINIKLDKTGGLTEALVVARQARTLGFKLMVGCMEGSSLGMAPAFIVGQLCDIIDLDGPLLIAADVDPPIRYDGGLMSVPPLALWG